MKTKHLITIAAAMLLMLVSLATHAQDVYEYATINHTAAIARIYVSYSNGNYEELETEKVKGFYNAAPVLSLLTKLSKEGWEVINANNINSSATWSFILKRKVK